MLDWEWYNDHNTKIVFIHLLLVANWKPGKWRGVEIGRGQRLTSFPKLAKETRLTVRNVRTAISHLESTGEIVCKPTNKYTLITITNYDKYQIRSSDTDTQNDTQNDTQSDIVPTNYRQASDKEVTTNEERNKETSIKDSYSFSYWDEEPEFKSILNEWRQERGLPIGG